MSRYLCKALPFYLLMLVVAGCSSNSRLETPVPEGFIPFHHPQPGDTLSSVAEQLDSISRSELQRYNPRSRENLRNTRRLRLPERSSDVPATGPYYYRIQRGDTLSKLAQHFHISLLSLMQANPEVEATRLQVGDRLEIPVRARDLNGYRWPVDDPQVRINFSWQRWGVHQGLTLETQPREEIFPIAPGRVVFAGEMRGMRRVIIVEHDQGRQSIYGYCHALFVEEGNRLSGRHPVCSAGHQRQINKPGIYFELRENGQAVSPEDYLPALPWN
ncbi:M23 family metallopeptidase [Marinospirillum perlucidum]|uniref:M23 family metallopeptidase n=1 Tax=Marinospirillum perlucidum TaxID=1982602 RepID=UPI000DF144F9|nr:M23 family metallopeptidase [Marinospirillum perlucidum]